MENITPIYTPIESLGKRLSFHQTFLNPIVEQSEDSKTNSPFLKNFKPNNFLELKINDKNTELRSPTSQRLSAISQTDKIMDLFELALNLERMKSYKIYFPHNNSEHIIHSLQLINAQSMKLKKKVFRKRKIISPFSSKICLVQSEKIINLKEEYI